jgi:hypothetical protein
MRNKNKTEKIDNDQEVIAKVNQDLLVRNMPSLKRLNSAPVSAAPLESGGELLSGLSKPKHNFKAVGVFIIFGGLVLIGGLVYASYIFIIKPQATNTLITTTTQPIQKTSSIVDTIGTNRGTGTDEVSVATTSVVATVTPITLDLATSSASSTINGDVTNNQVASATPIMDSDNDGLNDEEEKILGTDPQVADSNNNGYTDLVEINNGYNPVVSGKLNTNTNLAEYSNKTFGYKILYPKAWNVSVLNNDATTIFTASDNSIIQISIQDNSDKQGILGWYGSTFPDETITYDKLKSTDSWEGIWGSDNINFYLTDKAKKNIYVISFISPITGRVAYPNIYKLMINSLTIN